MALLASRKRHHKKKKRHAKRHGAAVKPVSKPVNVTKQPEPTTPKVTAPSTPSPSPPTPSPSASASPSPSQTPSQSASPSPSSSPSSNIDPSSSGVLPAPTVRERLYLNRFGAGFTQTGLGQLRSQGGADAWLAAQLSPASVPESSKVSEIDSWFSALTSTPAAKYAANDAKIRTKWTYGDNLGNWTLLRRIYSRRSLLETMTDFWSTHLHVPTADDHAWIYRYDYDQAIRANALGTFEDLLIACSLHPAMRGYLDNWRSARNAPNENQGRELLEVHTVGRDAGYTEDMVKASARILSGYTLDWGTGKTFQGYYDPSRHTTGAVQVLGFSDANTNVNGSETGSGVAVRYLRYLANHPATAQRVARKMAVYFVSDSPSDGLVTTLANVYTSSGTKISAVLTALSQHPEFLNSEGQKVRTPYADLVATSRVLDVDVHAPAVKTSWANSANSIHGGPALFSWPRPDGPPIDNLAWSSASRVLSCATMHLNLATGWRPSTEVTYRSSVSWLPSSSVRFDVFVDHLCRLWLGRAADARLLAGAISAVSRPGAAITSSTTVTPNHSLVGSQFRRLASALLDSPDHMTT